MNDQPHDSDVESRMIKIEELLSHQDQLMTQLNDAVTSINMSIQKLEDRQVAIEERLKWFVENALSSDFDPNEKPPHY